MDQTGKKPKASCHASTADQKQGPQPSAVAEQCREASAQSSAEARPSCPTPARANPNGGKPRARTILHELIGKGKGAHRWQNHRRHHGEHMRGCASPRDKRASCDEIASRLIRTARSHGEHQHRRDQGDQDTPYSKRSTKHQRHRPPGAYLFSKQRAPRRTRGSRR